MCTRQIITYTMLILETKSVESLNHRMRAPHKASQTIFWPVTAVVLKVEFNNWHKNCSIITLVAFIHLSLVPRLAESLGMRLYTCFSDKNHCGDSWTIRASAISLDIVHQHLKLSTTGREVGALGCIEAVCGSQCWQCEVELGHLRQTPFGRRPISKLAAEAELTRWL